MYGEAVDHGTAWCPDCRRRTKVDDRSTEHGLLPRGEVAYDVQWLACGHNLTRDMGVVHPGPGAPVGLPRAYDLGARPDPWEAAL